MARKRRVIVPLLVLVAAGVGAGIWWQRSHVRDSDGTIVLYGNVDIREVELAFNGTDRIQRVLVSEGDTVHAGQPVAQLDTRRMEAAVAQARAEVAAQEQVLAALEAGTRVEEVRRSEAEVRAAKARAIEAELLLKRTTDAFEHGAATRQEMDRARAEANTAIAALNAAGETLALAVAGPRKEDIASARAILSARRANLRLLEQRLSDTSLYAPAEGVIRDRILEPGDMASPGKPAMTLSITDPVWVRAYLSEDQLGKVHPGMQATVTTDSFPDKRYPAYVGYISPTAEFTPKTVQTQEVRTSLVYQVRIYAHNPTRELRLGMPATVTIQLDQAATLPTTSTAPAAENK